MKGLPLAEKYGEAQVDPGSTQPGNIPPPLILNESDMNNILEAKRRRLQGPKQLLSRWKRMKADKKGDLPPEKGDKPPRPHPQRGP